MKTAVLKTNSLEIGPIRWILVGLALITLYFQTTLADPINSPKFWILFTVAAWLFGYLISFRKIIFKVKPIKFIVILVLLFLLFLILATLFTDFPYVGIFGETQRRNGFLTYLALSIILITTSIFVRVTNIKKLFFATQFIGTIVVIYALMQTTGNDFIKWDNPYNSVIATLGNPNFAAAVMAIIGIITFTILFISSFHKINRIFAVLLSITLLFAIYRSNARQGLLAYILGVGVYLIIFLWGKSKKFGILALSAGIIIFIYSLLGMLQYGPLEKYLYKPSVSIRGYYWRAGIQMLINHPFFGVGIDRYGSYFKQYREVKYPLTYGFEITSTNAHNTFIQFFATGGFFLGFSYLIFNAYVLRRAYVGLKRHTGDDKLLLAGIFSAWIAFHAQSLISIDNIGISIWGWILGGSIIGLSITSDSGRGETQIYSNKRLSDINLNRAVVSGFMTIIAIILVAILYKGESDTYRASAAVPSNDAQSLASYKNLQFNVINATIIDQTYKLYSIANLIGAGFIDEGIVELQKVHLSDKRNLDALSFLAQTYESQNKINDAIKSREEISELDPWNAANYLALGKDYKSQGNSVKSKEMLDKILSFASENQIANQAKIDLAP